MRLMSSVMPVKMHAFFAVLRANGARRVAQNRDGWTVEEWRKAVDAAQAAGFTMFGQGVKIRAMLDAGASAAEIGEMTRADDGGLRIARRAEPAKVVSIARPRFSGDE